MILLKRLKTTAMTLMIIGGAVFYGCETARQPPDDQTVAVYEGGRITRQEIKKTIDQLTGHFSDDKEAVEQFQSKETYKKLITGMVLDRLVKRKIKAMKLDSRENIKHAMQHVSEELNIAKMHTRAHEQQIEVSEEEIKKRFEQDRQDFGQMTLIRAREQIRFELQAEKEKDYFESYLADLRKNAVITRNDELLKVPQPDEVELRAYYQQNRADYSGKSYKQVRDAILKTIRERNTDLWFEENRNRTLMTIHGKRFTLGEFFKELKELSVAEKKRYNRDFESRKALLDKLIDRLLIVEDTYDQMLNTETQSELGHIREDILRQVLHQEEVDDRIQVTEEEMRAFYKKNSDLYVTSPRVQINYIRIGAGQTEEDHARAEKKVKDAYEKLKPGLFKKGEPFAKVAEQYSEDPETAKKGGSLDGWISEDKQFLSEIASHGFHENVLRLGEDEISRPFLFHGSYYIVQVRKRQEPRPMPYEEVRDRIEAELRARKHQKRTRDMEKTLLNQADLIIFDKTIESMLADSS